MKFFTKSQKHLKNEIVTFAKCVEGEVIRRSSEHQKSAHQTSIFSDSRFCADRRLSYWQVFDWFFGFLMEFMIILSLQVLVSSHFMATIRTIRIETIPCQSLSINISDLWFLKILSRCNNEWKNNELCCVYFLYESLVNDKMVLCRRLLKCENYGQSRIKMLPVPNQLLNT